MPDDVPHPTLEPDTEEGLSGLVAALSLEQKVRLLTGADFWALHDEPAVGLRRVVTSDGPAGVRGELWDERDSSVNIPSPTAVAASWDPALVHDLGRLLAFEARRKGVDVLLAPTVNLHRSPYGGRHFECYSEDPLLTADIGTAFVRGLQSEGVAATVKHFVANDSETERLSVDMVLDERTLRELYLAPFEAMVTDAGAWAVMAAYNSVGGTTMTQSPLLRSVLQQEWAFDGLTMTDWYAGRSTDATGNAGLDLMMPGPTGPWREALVDAVRDGRVAEQNVDDKVTRVLRLAQRVGALAGGRPRDAAAWSTEQATGLVRRAAAAGFVLVRNAVVDDRPVLPMALSRLRSVAVIGPNGLEARFLGGGSALVFPDHTVSPLDGLREALGSEVEVTFCAGVRAHHRVSAAPARLLTTPTGRPGVQLLFRDGSGTLLGTDERTGTAFNWNNAFGDVDHSRLAEIELRTTVTADVTADYRIGTSGLGRFRLSLDGSSAFDELMELAAGADPVEGLMRPPQQWETLHLEEGASVEVVLTHVVKPHAADEDLLVAFQFNVDATIEDDEAGLRRAVDLATRSDVALVVVGTTEEVESEGFDRDSLALPGRQDELVRRVAKVRPETVVVVNAGSPVTMPWREEVAAVLVSWFPGQEFGSALADVLLGAVEPTGHLPTTWPADASAPLPSTRPVDGTLRYSEGLDVGYRRFLRDEVEPAYWFGHGLGYTDWSHDALTVAQRPGEDVEVTVAVRNTGGRPGQQLVQVYLARPDSGIQRPRQWLAGHALTTAEPGETSLVRVPLPRRRFAHWDVTTGGWTVEPGTYLVATGPSAGDLRCRAEVRIEPDV